MIKFAHIADCHLGGWRQPEMQKLNFEAFDRTISLCITEKIDFLLIAGDLFDTAMPSIDILKAATGKLRELKEAGIKCYYVAGSHDYSVSGKTFLHVLEKAGLCEDVETLRNKEVSGAPKTGKFSSEIKYGSNEDENSPILNIIEKENFIIAGISGKKGELEKETIRKIKTNAPNTEKFKILALHTTITENRTNDFMDGVDCEELPKGFDYYALGHIHRPFKKIIDGKLIVYPGPLFPNNFSELEELGNGGFFIVKYSEKIDVERVEIKVKNILVLEIDANCKYPEIVTSEAIGKIKKENVSDSIILLKISGTLARGKTSEVNYKEIEDEAKKAGSYAFIKNVSSFESPELKVKIDVKSEKIEDIEKEIMEKQKPHDFNKLSDTLLKILEIEKREGETTTTFEIRLFEEFSKITGVKLA